MPSLAGNRLIIAPNIDTKTSFHEPQVNFFEPDLLLEYLFLCLKVLYSSLNNWHSICKTIGKLTQNQSFVCLFDLILYVPSTIFQLNRDRTSWVEPVLS